MILTTLVLCSILLALLQHIKRLEVNPKLSLQLVDAFVGSINS